MMEWIDGVSDAIRYIEEHMTENLTMEGIAKQALVSPFYFQKRIYNALRVYRRGVYPAAQAHPCRQ